jgi:hypothetical protein
MKSLYLTKQDAFAIFVKRFIKSVHLSGAVVQLVRMPACHAGGRGFEPLLRRQTAGRKTGSLLAQIAQSVEQWTENPRVVGSIPTLGTTQNR